MTVLGKSYPARRCCWHAAVVSLLLCLSACAGAPPSPDLKNTVAVWNIENLTPDDGTQPDLGELLSAKVVEVIRNNGTYTVVERERLLLALEELHLGTTSLVDESTQLQLGRMAGANLMVFGGYQVIAGHMRLDLRLVEVETGKIQKAVERTTSATGILQWLDAAEQAAQDLL